MSNQIQSNKELSSAINMPYFLDAASLAITTIRQSVKEQEEGISPEIHQLIKQEDHRRLTLP